MQVLSAEDINEQDLKQLVDSLTLIRALDIKGQEGENGAKKLSFVFEGLVDKLRSYYEELCSKRRKREHGIDEQDEREEGDEEEMDEGHDSEEGNDDEMDVEEEEEEEDDVGGTNRKKNKNKRNMTNKGTVKTKSTPSSSTMVGPGLISFFTEDFVLSDLQLVTGMLQCLNVIIRIYLAITERKTTTSTITTSVLSSSLPSSSRLMVTIPEELFERTLLVLHSLLMNNFGDPLLSSSSSLSIKSEKTPATTSNVKTEKASDITAIAVSNKRLMAYLVSCVVVCFMLLSKLIAFGFFSDSFQFICAEWRIYSYIN